MGAAEKTRQMLAQALKELMKTSPLEKISVGDITQQAGVGLNTFYSHFKDKYDLVNWIFETESAQLLDSSAPADNWGDFLGQLDSYIRQNFSFYKNALDYSGQNSLQDYIFDVLEKRLTQRIGQMNEEMNLRMRPDEIAFTAGFFASALQGLLVRSIRQGLEPESSRYLECVRRICSGHMIENYLRMPPRGKQSGNT